MSVKEEVSSVEKDCR